MTRIIGKLRRRRDICKSHEPSLEIPHELLIEILTRLPAKSLMRFKSVSKLWSSLISSQYFIDRFQKVSSPSLRIYMRLSFYNNPLQKVLLSSSSSSSPGLELSSFVVDQDLTIPAIQGYYVSHVYHGLMCFVNGRSAQIYNTSTRQLLVLPDIEELKLIAGEDLRLKRCITYYIGHEPVHNQYKVVCIVSDISIDMTEIWLLLLGEDHDSSQWRKISKPIQPHLPFLSLSKGSRLSINGRMYYLAFISLHPHLVLVSIDIRSEEISILQIPEYSKRVDLIEFDGKVALLDHFDLKNKGVMDLWVLEDVEKKIWSKKKTLVLDPSQMHIVNGMSSRVQGTTRNGEVVFVPREEKIEPQSKTIFYVFLYNIQNNHMRKVEIKATSNSHRTKIWGVIGFDDVENLMYL